MKGKKTTKRRSHPSMLAKLFKDKSLKQVSFSQQRLIIFAVAFALIGGYVIYRSFAAGPAGTANLWMSPNGSDAGVNCVWNNTPVPAPADLSTACASVSKAYSLAPATGGLVLLTDGYYNAPSGYTCPSGGTWTTPHTDWLTFSPAPNANPKFTCHLSICTNGVSCYVKFSDNDPTKLATAAGNLWLGGEGLGGQHIEFDNIDTACQDAAPYPLSTTIAEPGFAWPYSATNQYCSAYIRGNAQHVLYKGGSIGPTMEDSCASPNNDAQDSSIGYGLATQRATDWVFDGIYSHDARAGAPNPSPPCGRSDSAHTENFYLTDFTDITIKNSLFKGCGNSTCIFSTNQVGGADPANNSQNLSIINNIFRDGAVDIGWTTNAIVAYNDAPGGGFVMGSSAPQNVSFIGNIGSNNPCPDVVAHAGGSPLSDTATYSHNLWVFDTSTGGSANQCGASDTLYNVGHNPRGDIFANWPTGSSSTGDGFLLNGDFHLKSGTNPAVDIGDVSNYALANPDYYGRARYSGGAPDAGASEYIPPPGTANVFVAANGSDAGSNCKRFTMAQANPDGGGTSLCASFDKAYQLASTGDTVEVEGGTYQPQTVNYDVAKTSLTNVIFRPAVDQTVNFNACQTYSCASVWIKGGRHITFTNNGAATSSGFQFVTIATEATGINTLADDITFNDTHFGMFTCGGTTNLTLTNNDIGNYTSDTYDGEDSQLSAYGGNGGTICDGVTITDNHFHDMSAANGSHTECLQAEAGNNILIERNTFKNCFSDAIFLLADFGNLTNVTVQNNLIFAPLHTAGDGTLQTTDPVSITVGDRGSPGNGYHCGGIKVLNNSSAANDGAGDVIDGGCTGPGAGSMLVASNTMYSSPGLCPAGVSYSYIIFETGAGCGTNKIIGAVNYPNRSSDLLVTSGNVIDTGSPNAGEFAAADYLGTTRPQGAAPDIGAYEFVAAPPPPPGSPAPPPPTTYKTGDLNHDGSVNVFDLSILLSNYSTNHAVADIDVNGTVNVIDLSILLSNYGK